MQVGGELWRKEALYEIMDGKSGKIERRVNFILSEEQVTKVIAEFKRLQLKPTPLKRGARAQAGA